MQDPVYITQNTESTFTIQSGNFPNDMFKFIIYAPYKVWHNCKTSDL